MGDVNVCGPGSQIYEASNVKFMPRLAHKMSTNLFLEYVEGQVEGYHNFWGMTCFCFQLITRLDCIGIKPAGILYIYI